VRKLVASFALALGVAGSMWTPVAADGSWIDQQPLGTWNTPGAPVPTAPAVDIDHVDPRCFDLGRPVESLEDEQLVQAGWHLVGQYWSGWNTRVVIGTSNFDGMCRPSGYQIFVFSDGVFAGTASPDLMDSRTDGAGGANVQLYRQLTVPGVSFRTTFSRYLDTDPLCCPSSTSAVEYVVTTDDPTGEPVVKATSASTTSNATTWDRV
jgi:hypothetical protein